MKFCVFWHPYQKMLGKNIFGVKLALFANFQAYNPHKTARKKEKSYFQTWIRKNYVFRFWFWTSKALKSFHPNEHTWANILYRTTLARLSKYGLLRINPYNRGRGSTHRRLESWPSAAVRFCTLWTDHTACLFHTVPVALTGAAQLRAEGISSCWYIVNVNTTQPSVMSYVTQGRHDLVL
jgi:hypothetical protein